MARAGAAAVGSGDPGGLTGRVEQGLYIERLVAEGGMGAVYAARVLATGERVALKVLSGAHAGEAGAAGWFAREVLLARRVDHPNVCPVLADGRVADGRPYLLMPLIEGITLGEDVRVHGPMAVGRALAIADQILAGIEALHAAGVVHRDLQPGNVLIERGSPVSAEAWRPGSVVPARGVRLIDLGFAHEPGVDTGDGVTRDSPGSLVGTPRFMSPEQATRSRAITPQSDLFSAALLVYFALTGKLPFRGRSDVDALVALVRSAPIPLRRARRDAPRALEAALSRALHKHPDARFEGARAMRRALAEIRA